jgi:hypothetical protein
MFGERRSVSLKQEERGEPSGKRALGVSITLRVTKYLKTAVDILINTNYI